MNIALQDQRIAILSEMIYKGDESPETVGAYTQAILDLVKGLNSI